MPLPLWSSLYLACTLREPSLYPMRACTHPLPLWSSLYPHHAYPLPSLFLQEKLGTLFILIARDIAGSASAPSPLSLTADSPRLAPPLTSDRKSVV